MDTRRKIKVIVSMIGLDEHTVGGVVISSILRNAGMEVVYLGTYQTPEMIVRAAIQEDVDVIGISSHGSNYGQVGELMDLLRQENMEDIPVIIGGTIPKQQLPKLKEKGVAEFFPPHSRSESIINYIVSNVNRIDGIEGLKQQERR